MSRCQANIFIVLRMLVQGAYQPVFSDDDGIMCFLDIKSAEGEVHEAIDDVAEAIKEGHMDEDSRVTREDYEIVPATIVNPWADPKNQKIVCFFEGREYEMTRSDDDWKVREFPQPTPTPVPAVSHRIMSYKTKAAALYVAANEKIEKYFETNDRLQLLDEAGEHNEAMLEKAKDVSANVSFYHKASMDSGWVSAIYKEGGEILVNTTLNENGDLRGMKLAWVDPMDLLAIADLVPDGPVPSVPAGLKSQVLEMAREFLSRYEEDIETGIADGTYKAKDNVESRQLIADATALFEQFEKKQIEVYAYVRGGVVLGASATEPLSFNVFDYDNSVAEKESEGRYEMETMETPEEWEAMIKKRTDAGELIPVY